MEAAMQQELFDLLKQEIKEMGMDTTDVEGAGGPQAGDTLRVLLPITDESIPVILDIMAINVGEDADIVQFYTTLSMELGSGREELIKAIPAFNFFCPIGTFGIFQQEQLYHKYGFLLRAGATAEELCTELLDVLAALYNVLDAHYPIAMRLADGEQTCEQAAPNWSIVSA
ncbi:MAG: hypothetical protein PHO41_05705 [Eubacteriales bacterium]|nr:hypothetical protein [Eubacteriales bacterium]